DNVAGTDRGPDDQLFADFDIVVTDEDGSFAPGTLSIAINDDGPTAVADADSVESGATATGNVITDAEANGDSGADTAGADGAVVSYFVAGAVAGDVLVS